MSFGIRQPRLVHTPCIKMVEVDALFAWTRIDDQIFPHPRLLIFVELIGAVTADAAIRHQLDHQIGRPFKPISRHPILMLASNEKYVWLP